MSRPFSERVAAAGWRIDAESWIADQVTRRGHALTAPIRQPRIRPWSTHLVVSTDAGRVWFKATCASMSFEPALHAELARLVPEAVDDPYAIDPRRGWMMTVDRGATLGDSHHPTRADWRQTLGEAARLQRTLAAHGDDLRAAGLPDCSPGTVLDRFDRLVQTFAGLPEPHPSHVSADLESRLRARRPSIADAVEELHQSVLPTTWQHGDLHPWNVFAVSSEPGAGALRLFDFGDAQWASAAEILSVPYAWITSRTDLDWSAVAEVYCQVWDVDPVDLRRLTGLTALTQPVNRVLTWWGCLAEASAAEWLEWGDAPLEHLTRILDP